VVESFEINLEADQPAKGRIRRNPSGSTAVKPRDSATALRAVDAAGPVDFNDRQERSLLGELPVGGKSLDMMLTKPTSAGLSAATPHFDGLLVR
jgi:hypothetical protein